MQKILNQLKVLYRARYPYIYLVSWEEERVLRHLRQWMEGDQCQSWTSTTGFGSENRPQTPLECLNAIRQAPSNRIFCLRDFHPFLRNPEIIRSLRDLEPNLVEQHKMVLFLSPKLQLPQDLEKDIEVLDVPLPVASDVARMLNHVLKRQSINMDSDIYERTVKASLGLTEKEIMRVYTRILVNGGRFTDDDLELLIQEKRRILRRSDFLEFLDMGEGLTDVGGMGQLKEWLEIRGKAFSEKARQFGLPQPKGLFMLGVQGCGKSLTAKAVARAWRMPLIRLDVGALVTGSSDKENSLRQVISISESMAPVVLWIDEIEKAFSGVSGSGAQANITRIFGGLLTWLQEKEKPVFVIATANDITNLPPELLRKGRFDEIFFIDLPGIHDRESILGIHLKKRGRDPKLFDLYAIAEATDKYSGAELEQLVIASLFRAFAKKRPVNTRDLLIVARETVPLAVTMDDKIKALKEWALPRTRPAAFDTRRVDFFEEWAEVDA